MEGAKKIRRAQKAGSWYEADGAVLGKQLDEWLATAQKSKQRPTKAIIGPHAGYSYSGPTAAWAYKHFDPKQIKRIFLFGPSHHAYFEKLGLTAATELETPVGNIPVDTKLVAELMATGLFEKLSTEVDEDEHSLELHMPYIHRAMAGNPYTIVPIMVNSPSKEQLEVYGKQLAKYFEMPDTLFVISSDFCHWGKRFSFTYYNKACGEIHQSIEDLDRKGMKLIEAQDLAGWYSYLKEYKNTICGRYPISLLLNVLKASKEKYDVAFVQYAQSSKCKSDRDSSVSYASAVISSL